MAMSVGDYKDHVQAWINEHWPDTDPCPMCRTTSGWELGAPANILLRDDLQNFPMAQVLPAVTLVCAKCGYLVFLSAIKIGLIGPDGRLTRPPASDATRDGSQ